MVCLYLRTVLRVENQVHVFVLQVFTYNIQQHIYAQLVLFSNIQKDNNTSYILHTESLTCSSSLSIGFEPTCKRGH